MPFNPTAREVVILGVLLVSLLYLSATFPRNDGAISELLAGKPYLVEEGSSVLPMTLETQYTLQSLNAPLSWGAEPVPETKIVAHVPGKCYLLPLSVLYHPALGSEQRRRTDIWPHTL